jgi:hypothetical protein
MKEVFETAKGIHKELLLPRKNQLSRTSKNIRNINGMNPSNQKRIIVKCKH